MARVFGAERDFVKGNIWTAIQLADLQSINKIFFVTAEIIKGRGLKLLLSAVNRVQAILVSRKNTLRNLIIGRKRKRGT